MKKQIIVSLFLLFTILHHGQTQESTTYVGRYILSTNIESFILIDPVTEIKYVLDSDQIYITSYDKDDNQLWQTDPWKDNNLRQYRVERPIIVRFYFSTYRESEIIWITYNNTQFGIIDKLTGEFCYFGQD